MAITTMSVEEHRNMSAAAMRTYPNIVRDWQLKEHDAADSWLRRANQNPLFSGQPPLDRLRSGLVSDLYVVRQHLDAT